MRVSALIKWPFLASLALAAVPALAADEVNLYTTREPGLIQPLLDSFSRDTGIKVNTVFVADGLLERVRAEGGRSPADVLMTVDSGNLLDLVGNGLTQGIESATLESVVPAHLRGADGSWFTLSLRDRVLYAHKDLELDSFNYEDLADPKWKGKVCIRSGQHPYNISLIAAMIAHDGVEATENWLRGVKANLARKAAGGDRDVARDILAGICDLGLANAYYVGRMKNEPAGSEQRRWGDAIKVIRPHFAYGSEGGTHVNISGAAVARHAPNRGNAVRLLEYLVGDQAQSLYAKANYEYPVKAGVELDPVVASFGALKVDPLPMTEIARFRKQASELVDRVGFDN
ncbi:Fe(3+) ABC transporter substrate-binding protein [Pseudofulvimonas gallinarii]|jgi:iron(III) transport system substrate-binding protein|uniref:Iron(III) transport system substrate-binding protein n=1 Tax=Pseudofulvimonas gallinarii TaxID=634155 RepID=A0A4R3LSP8_9GAMM|nr:Fe(3+) ABC transporter substrate-binding protein [Pseudofulvimonas gallinarii]TCT01267.1 iron(III) transport system substrate-binding protein [Pseudofulvimonas gallinarii]THD15029.1 iron ABC transporter substrate-binding protein [Pseudofulvimonas gallinarii]